jgi:Putative zinc-finger
MQSLFHLTGSLADDFLYDRLSETEQSRVTLHLEECQDCRKLILFSITGAEHLVGLPSAIQLPKIDEKYLRLCLEWMHGSGEKMAGGKTVLWP